MTKRVLGIMDVLLSMDGKEQKKAKDGWERVEEIEQVVLTPHNVRQGQDDDDYD